MDDITVREISHYDWSYYQRLSTELGRRLQGDTSALWSDDWRDGALENLTQFGELIAVGAYELTPDIEELRQEVAGFTERPEHFEDSRYFDRFWRHWALLKNRAEYWYAVFQPDLDDSPSLALGDDTNYAAAR